MPNKPPIHRPHARQALAQRQSADRARKRAQGTRYNGARWRKLRAAFLAAHPLCVDCQAQGRVTAAEVVDHKVTWDERPDLAYDEANLQGLCKHHHDVKTATRDGGFGHKPKEGA